MLDSIVIDSVREEGIHLAEMLKCHCSKQVNINGLYTSVQESLHPIRKMKPQLIFIDADLHRAQGKGYLANWNGSEPAVIFSSSSEQYAYHAFKNNALDYLLKPYQADDLIKAVNKLTVQTVVGIAAEKYDNLLSNIEQLKQYTPPKKIMVPTTHGFELLPVIDILRCVSAVNYTTIVMKDKHKIVVAKTLKEFEAMLSSYNFFRIHNSHLVNLAYIKSYHKGKGGSVILSDGSEIEVSTRRKEEFLKRMGEL